MALHTFTASSIPRPETAPPLDDGKKVPPGPSEPKTKVACGRGTYTWKIFGVKDGDIAEFDKGEVPPCMPANDVREERRAMEGRVKDQTESAHHRDDTSTETRAMPEWFSKDRPIDNLVLEPL